MKLDSWIVSALGIAAAATAFFSAPPALQGQTKSDKSAVAGANQMAGLGSISGLVWAPKDFKAAKVFARNIEKNVIYMVYTEDGRYLAVGLFPGNYEVSVAKNGFTSKDVEKVTVREGAMATADFTLQEGSYRPAQQKRSAVPNNEPLLAYDDLYPAGAGRQIIERTCIRCHGPDFLPNHQWDADQWNAAIDLMQSTELNSNPPGRISPSSVPEGISREERQTLIDYLVKNFGPDSTRRGLAIREAPVDENALGKAEFIEYRVPPLANGHDRRFHDEHLSVNGDVWYTDANGLQIGKMDPRTATWTDYPLPDAKYRGHGLVQDANGDIWVSGHTAFVRVDSKTGSMQFYPYHANGLRPDHGNTPTIDSKQNIWTTLMYTDEVAKWDRKTGEVSRFTVPTPYAAPYGMVTDKKDNLWIAEWFACKIARFDTSAETFTEFVPPTKPCNIRRVFVDHAGMVWYAMDSPGKIGMLNPDTGKMVTYEEPVPFGFPYDIQEDSENNLWIADSGQGGGLYRFDTQTTNFTYFDAVQRTDMPKISMSREDSIWYTTRGGDSKTMALGVLYPDKTKIKTLAAYLH
jgi:sugar lactone lactonase YvrE/mono/diheme cytochrome c family protein